MALLAVPVMVLALWFRGTPDAGGTDVYLPPEAVAGEAGVPMGEPPAAAGAAGLEHAASSGMPPGAAQPEALERAVVSPAVSGEAPSTGLSASVVRRPVEGRLVVLSEPAGAMVTVNGIGHGPTPATVQYLPMGDQRIRVTLPGYRSEERVVRLADDDPSRTMRIVLRRWQE